MLVVDSIINLGGKIIDKIFPDKTEAEKAKLKLLELQQQGQLAELNAELQIAVAQTEVNKEEARSGNPYAASWRPTIGYVCAFSLAWHFILHPLCLWATAVWAPDIIPPPQVDIGALYPMILGILGLGTARTFEKLKGKA